MTRIVPVSLELGGKSPSIVFPDANEDWVIDGIIAAMRAERLIGAWNEREGRRMPLLFAPTIGRRARVPASLSLGLLPRLPHNARY
jgi:hypothetical protein